MSGLSAAQRRKRRHSPSSEVIPKAIKLSSLQFRHGAIRRMVLHNFLTFDDVEIQPSPQLNVIVGPNGTGKSSLVCAMCLGLGGHPSLLGRAKLLKEFVKHGPAKTGFIEITLHHSSGNHPTIRREIKKENSSSKWFLNGHDKLEKEIVEFIKQFNIQLENKCQFLPQDKVVEFAKLDCYQLLEETEKAIGKDDMYDLHQKLKAMKSDKQVIEKQLGSRKQELEMLVRANSLLERDVLRIRTRQDCIQQIKHLEWKGYWLKYEDARNAFNSCKAERKEAERDMRVLHSQLNPRIEMLKEKQAIVEDFQRKEEKCILVVSSVQKRVFEKQRNLDQLQDEQELIVNEFKLKQKEEDARKRKINQLKAEVESFSSEIEKLDPPEVIQPKIASINRELHQLRQELIGLQEQEQPLMDDKAQYQQSMQIAQEKLRKIEDVYNQRLIKLDQRDHHTYRAICWLKDNLNRFQKPVHQPVIVLLQIKEMRYAPQIEDFFMGRDAYSFIFECKQDYELFATEVRDKMNLKVNMVVAPDQRLQDYRPSVPTQVLRSYGFRHRLMDLVEAPDPVLAYFCKYFWLHEVPIADSAQVTQFVNTHRSIQKFYVGNDVYGVKHSRYSNKTITKSNHVRPCQFFLSSVNEVEKASLLADIQEAERSIVGIDHQLAKLQTQEAELRRRDGQARQRRNDLREIGNERGRLNRTRNSKQIQLNQLHSSPVDLEREREDYKEKITLNFENRIECLQKIKENLVIYRDVLMDRTCTHFDLTEADLRKKKYDSENESISTQLKRAEESVNKVKHEEASAKNTARRLLEIAKRKTGFASPDAMAQSDYYDIFKDLPNDMPTIEEKIHELKTQVEMCTGGNSGEDVIEEFERRKREIEKLQEEIEEDENKLSSHNNETTSIKERWLEPLKEMMGEVNKRFSKFFSMMKCAGEVSLLEHSHDYSKFGVEIRVKFRSEELLQVLNAQRQSGGERSVSTMMYLMALQDITSCPFRVVDEINQGMDSANERRVFNLIVETVQQNHTSQYFMLTPKLLQGLSYSECVTVHSVHNGPELMPYDHWPH